MKKVTTLLATLTFLSSISFAQQKLVSDYSHPKTGSLLPDNNAKTKSKTKPVNYQQGLKKAGGDTIWYEDFGSGLPAGWTTVDINGLGFDWIWSNQQTNWTAEFTNTAPVASTTKANGYMILFGDSFNTPGGSTAMDAYFQTSAIDLSAYPSVSVKFQQRFRYCCSAASKLSLFVSNDGATWTEFDTKGGVAVNAFPANNPDIANVNISSVAGGKPTVYLRFHKQGASHYIWMVDDIAITVAPDNDMELTTYRYLDNFLTPFYTNIPYSQRGSVSFNGRIGNIGSVAQPNVKLNVDVQTGGNTVYSQSPSISILNTGTDTLLTVATPFVPFSKGTFSVSFNAASDSVDANPADNTASASIVISDTVYSRDNGIATFALNAGGYTETGPFAFGNWYEFATNDTIVSISFRLGATTAVGTSYLATVYKDDGASAFFPGTALGSSNFATVQAGEPGNWVTIPIAYIGGSILTGGSPGSELAIPAGSNTWVVIDDAQVGDDSLRIGAHGELDPNGISSTAYLGTQWWTINEVPLIRANVKSPASVCALSGTTAITNVSCKGANDGEVNITISGGTPSYTYSWNNPSSSTTEDVSGLAPGVYTVSVLDATGCPYTLVSTITEPTELIASDSVKNVNCFGGTDGVIYALGSGGTNIYDVVIFSENFSAGIPGTWQNIDNLTGGIWTYIPGGGTTGDGTSLNSSTTGNGYVAFDSDGAGNDLAPEDADLITPMINCSSQPVVRLEFEHFFQSDFGGAAIVSVSNNGGSTYTQVGSWSAVSSLNASLEDIDISSIAANNDSVMIKFNWTGDYSWYWLIDDIRVYSPATSDYLYSSNGITYQTNSTFTGLGAGTTYKVFVKDGNGCVDSVVNISITAPAALAIGTTVTNVSCFAGSNGKAIAAVTGGTPGYTYLWNDAGSQANDTASWLPAATYVVTVTDNNVCSATGVAIITEPAVLATTMSSTPDTCSRSDGTATAASVGGTSPYTYTWNDPASQTTGSATGLATGAYTVTVADANGCDTVSSVTVLSYASGVAIDSLVSVNASSCVAADGKIVSFVTGGKLPYTYVWNDPASQTNDTALGLSGGNIYNLLVTDALSCTDTGNEIVNSAGAQTVAIDSTKDVSCKSGTDGVARVAATGGTPPYTYVWSGGANPNDSLTGGLAAGTYNVTVFDSAPCQALASVTINESPTELLYSTSTVNSSCFAGSNGKAIAAATGGTPGYTYLWNDAGSQTNDTASGLPAATYVVTVTDAKGCMKTDTAVVGQPSAISINKTVINASCFAGSNGKAIVAVTGGTPGYTYLWNDAGSQANDTASGLLAATYVVTVTDANGCMKTDTAVVGQPSNITIVTTVTNVSCFAGSNGKAIAAVTGGTPGYTYLWNDPTSQTNDTASGLPAATYAVTVTDNNVCSATGVAIITEPAVLATTMSSTPDTCSRGDGTATAASVGGTSPYTYTWNDPASQTTGSATGLTPGAYTITVTDANGCDTVSSVTVVAYASGVSVDSLVSVNASSCVAADGKIVSFVTGGKLPYTYVWNDPTSQTNDTALGLSGGNIYNLLVTDALSCTDTGNEIVNSTGAHTVAIDSTKHVSCKLGTDGVARVAATGGTPPYTYVWSGGANPNDSITGGLAAGTYNVTVFDAALCQALATVTITEPTQLLSSASAINSSCFAGSTGKAIVTATGGTPGYVYVWNDAGSQTNDTASGLLAATYVVTVTDAKGCMKTDTAVVGQPSAISIGTTVTSVSCFAGSNGKAIVAATGGTPGYTYRWNDPTSQTNDTASGLPAATYVVTVTDANGCMKTDTAVVGQPSAVSIGTTVTSVSCKAGSNGKAIAAATGGTPGYAYVWNDAGSQTNDTASGLPAATYVVTVTDANNCTATGSAIVTEPATAVSIVVSPDTCSATATGSGGTGTLTYKWSDPASQTTATATGLAPGAYTVTVTDVNNCTDTASVTILLCVGIDKISAADFSATVYPNPNNGKFVISITGAVKDDYVIEIRDIIGKVVYSNKFDNISGKLVNQLDVSLQNQGVYFVNIKSSKGITTKKLVIQH